MKCCNCGKEINNGSKFCFYCGAPVQEVRPIYNMMPQKNQQETTKMIALGLGISYLMQLILWFCKSLKASGLILSMSFSMLQASPGLINLTTIIILLAMSALCFVQGSGKKIPLIDIFGIISQVWCSGWMLIQRAIGSSVLSDSYVLAQVSFTGGGLLSVMISICALGAHIVRLILSTKKNTDIPFIPHRESNFQSL